MEICKARSNHEDCALPAGHHGEFHCDANGYCWGVPFRPADRVAHRSGSHIGTVLFTEEAANGLLLTWWITDEGQRLAASPAILTRLEL
jgi:hypothetical protein